MWIRAPAPRLQRHRAVRTVRDLRRERDDLAGDVEPGRTLQPLETGARVQLHHLGALAGLEQVHSRNVEPDHPGCAHGRLGVIGGKLYRRPEAAAMQVAAELAPARLPPHGAHYAIADHQRADVAPPRLRDELLEQDLLAEVPERAEDALHLRDAVGDHHAHALGALDQLEDRRQAADLRDQLRDLAAAAGEHRAGDAHSRRGEVLERRQLVAAAGDGGSAVDQRDSFFYWLRGHREPDGR